MSAEEPAQQREPEVIQVTSDLVPAPNAPPQVLEQFALGHTVVIFCLTEQKPHQMTYKSELWIKGLDTYQGYFSMSGHGFFREEAKDYSEHQRMQLNIQIEDSQQGRGYSFQLIRALCEYILDTPRVHEKPIGGLDRTEIVNSYILLIDSDASDGFWERAGLTDSRHYDSTRPGLAGFEKDITFQRLYNRAQTMIQKRQTKPSATSGGYTKRRYRYKVKRRTMKYKNRKSRTHRKYK